MRKLLLAVVALCICHAVPASAGPTYPTRLANAGLVNDFANVIPDDQQAALETDLRAFEQKYHAEIAVVSVTSMGGYPVEEYANGLFRTWGIGKKGADNGVLILVSTGDRKARIEVGYRFEPILTDADTSVIMRNSMHDRFHKNDFGGGLVSGAHAVMDFLEQTLPAENQQIISKATPKVSSGSWFPGILIAIFPIGFILLMGIVFTRRMRKAEAEVVTRRERADLELRDDGLLRPTSRRTRSIPTPMSQRTRPSPEPARKRDEEPSSSRSSRSDDDDDGSSILGSVLGSGFGSSSDSDSSSSFGSSSSDSGGFDFGGGSSGGGGSSDSF